MGPRPVEFTARIWMMVGRFRVGMVMVTRGAVTLRHADHLPARTRYWWVAAVPPEVGADQVTVTLPRLGADTLIALTGPGAAPGCGVEPAVVAVAVAPPSVCPKESVPVTNTVTAVFAGRPDTVTRPDCSKLTCEASTRPERVDADAS